MKQIKYEELEGQSGALARIEYETEDIIDKKDMVRFAQEVIDTHFQRNGGLQRVSVLEVGETMGREVLEEVKESWYQLSQLGTFDKELSRIIIAGYSHLLSVAFQMVLFRDTKKILILSPEAYYFEKNGQNALDEALLFMEQRVAEEKSGMRKVTREDYLRAGEFWEERDKEAAENGKKLQDKEVLSKRIEGYLTSKKVCVLSTCSENMVRSTPIEYMFFDGKFWMFSEGGQKFKNLLKNKNVSLCVFNENADFRNIKSVQVTGEAEVVDYFSGDYFAAVKRRGLSEEKLRAMENPMNLIVVVPSRYELLDAAFAAEKLDVRQTLTI